MARGIQPYIKKNGTLLKIQRFPILSRLLFNEMTKPDYRRHNNQITFLSEEDWNTVINEIGYNINKQKEIEVIECNNALYPYLRIRKELPVTKELEKETLDMISKLKRKKNDSI